MQRDLMGTSVGFTIPMKLKKIIERNFKKYPPKSTENLESFVDNCMQDLIDLEKIHTNYQARASKTGEMFEYIFYYLMKNGFDIIFEGHISLPKACMVSGGELDFGLRRNKKLICGVETKGSARKVIHPNGQEETLPRPALLRTDTVKKAICNAYQFKRVYPKIPFFLVTNVIPDSGNAKCMLDLAEGDIIDDIVNITDFNDLKNFVNTIKKL